MIELATSWHEREAARRPDDDRACEVVTLDAYPYPCESARKRPADVVRQCTVHGCWWTHNPETGRDRTDELNDRLAGRRLHRLR